MGAAPSPVAVGQPGNEMGLLAVTSLATDGRSLFFSGTPYVSR